MNGASDHANWLKMSFVVFDAPAINLLFTKRLEVKFPKLIQKDDEKCFQE